MHIKSMRASAVVAQLAEHNLPKVGVASSRLVYRSLYHLKRNDMTEIVVFDRNAKIVFRSVVPRLLTQSQVERELDDWRIDRANHRVQIIYTE